MSVSRTVSAAIAVAYVTIAVTVAGFLAGARTAAFCLLPCACIWFPEAMVDYTGDVFSNVTKTSPPSFVFVLGWVVLLTPFIGLGFMWIASIGMHLH